MKNQLVATLQKKYHESGYALVSPKSGKVFAFEKSIQRLYNTIEEKQIPDKDKIVMHVPAPGVKHVLHISLPIRLH